VAARAGPGDWEGRKRTPGNSLLQESRLPLEKTFGNFDLQRLPPKAARHIMTLQDGTFLDRKENVLVFGNPGSGKTHLLSALGQELIRSGRRVAFTICTRLVQELLLAKKELRLNRAIRKLAYYEALVIDDLGCVFSVPVITSPPPPPINCFTIMGLRINN
jgi:DNA replication protein DnaC